jgi:Protein of unknown function (DUF3618)
MAQEPNEIDVDVRRESHTTAATAVPPPTADELRLQIEGTRAEMGETIDAIQARLRPGALLANATETVKDATVDRLTSLASTASTKTSDLARCSSRASVAALTWIKNHPLPVALAGVVGIGFVVRRLKKRRRF